MPCLIIETQDDGTVLIAAPAQVPKELLADAEQVANLEEAAKVMQDVLGGGEEAGPGEAGETQDQEGGEGQDSGGTPPDASQPAQGTDDPMAAAMQQGYSNVRGNGRR